MTTLTRVPSTTTPSRNPALIAARVIAGLFGALQAAASCYFLFVIPDEGVWRGPAIDIPVLGLLYAGIALELILAFAPRLTADRRIKVGLVCVGLSVVASVLKIVLYGEPEGATLLGIDAVLLVLLLVARRRNR